MSAIFNPRVLSVLARPQYDSGCNFASLTAMFRYFYPQFSGLSQKSFAKAIAIEPGNSHNSGNITMIKWAELFASRNDIEVSGEVLFKDSWKFNSPENTGYWNTLQELLLDENNFLIMHFQGHYNLICGCAAYAKTPDEEGSEERWVFLADHSPFHEESRQPENHWESSPPLWSVRWGQIREEFDSKPIYGILRFQKKQ